MTWSTSCGCWSTRSCSGPVSGSSARPATRSPCVSSTPGPSVTASPTSPTSSSAPLAKLQAYKRRMGWSFPWASSSGSDFSYDFQAAYTIEQQSGAADHNFRTIDMRPQLEADPDNPWLTALAGPVGTDWPTYRQEEPGVSAFALDETGFFGAPAFPYRRHDEYDS